MKSLTCETVRELLPEWKAGILPGGKAEAVEVHLSGCSECREDLVVLEALILARPEPPRELEERIQARLRRELAQGTPEREERKVLPLFGGRRWVPAWALSAAAVVFLALGARLIMGPDGWGRTEESILVAVQQPLPEAWLWNDGMVAGAPVLEDLSDEELEALVEAWEGG